MSEFKGMEMPTNKPTGEKPEDEGIEKAKEADGGTSEDGEPALEIDRGAIEAATLSKEEAEKIISPEELEAIGVETKKEGGVLQNMIKSPKMRKFVMWFMITTAGAGVYATVGAEKAEAGGSSISKSFDKSLGKAIESAMKGVGKGAEKGAGDVIERIFGGGKTAREKAEIMRNKINLERQIARDQQRIYMDDIRQMRKMEMVEFQQALKERNEERKEKAKERVMAYGEKLNKAKFIFEGYLSNVANAKSEEDIEKLKETKRLQLDALDEEMELVSPKPAEESTEKPTEAAR